ncbi:flavin monoamine oxidase family protein [Lysobacter humi (ex Lee et al. 2017)]
MAQLLRMARLAERCARTGEGADEVTGDTPEDIGRRRLLQGATAGAAALGAGAVAARMRPGTLAQFAQFAQLASTTPRMRGVAVVGAGLAGLACASELARVGISARVFEAGTRVGGRCWSLRGVFPGQTAERGAEFIGTAHHTMLGYARMLGLQLEESAGTSARAAYYFAGRYYTEAQVLEEYRAFAECIRPDLIALGAPTAEAHTEQAVTFDLMSVDDYLGLYGAGTLLRTLIGTACETEFGVGADSLSAIAFLRFVYGDRRTKLAAYGAQRADQLHVIGGNDLIATGLAARLPRPVEFGARLVAVRRTATGTLRLTFDQGGNLVQSDHDALVLAVPMSVLGDIDFHPSVALPESKRRAIAQSTMGAASKLIVGFQRPYWHMRNRVSGVAQADLPGLQNVWETNPARRDDSRGILTQQIGGAAARLLHPQTVQGDARRFVESLEVVMPGGMKAVRRGADGVLHAVSQNWSLDPLSRGAFPAPAPGYFTTIAHTEAKPVDNVFFAGDHTSSFYEWQGFMEGAALSGLRAAAETAALLRGG